MLVLMTQFDHYVNRAHYQYGVCTNGPNVRNYSAKHRAVNRKTIA